jgi:hypothetical protein
MNLHSTLVFRHDYWPPRELWFADSHKKDALDEVEKLLSTESRDQVILDIHSGAEWGLAHVSLHHFRDQPGRAIVDLQTVRGLTQASRDVITFDDVGRLVNGLAVDRSLASRLSNQVTTPEFQTHARILVRRRDLPATLGRLLAWTTRLTLTLDPLGRDERLYGIVRDLEHVATREDLAELLGRAHDLQAEYRATIRDSIAMSSTKTWLGANFRHNLVEHLGDPLEAMLHKWTASEPLADTSLAVAGHLYALWITLNQDDSESGVRSRGRLLTQEELIASLVKHVRPASTPRRFR